MKQFLKLFSKTPYKKKVPLEKLEKGKGERENENDNVLCMI